MPNKNEEELKRQKTWYKKQVNLKRCVICNKKVQLTQTPLGAKFIPTKCKSCREKQRQSYLKHKSTIKKGE